MHACKKRIILEWASPHAKHCGKWWFPIVDMGFVSIPGHTVDK